MACLPRCLEALNGKTPSLKNGTLQHALEMMNWDDQKVGIAPRTILFLGMAPAIGMILTFLNPGIFNSVEKYKYHSDHLKHAKVRTCVKTTNQDMEPKSPNFICIIHVGLLSGDQKYSPDRNIWIFFKGQDWPQKMG